MLKRKLAFLVLIPLLLTGCDKLPVNEDISEDAINTFTSMEEVPDLTYEVPESSPNILINQLGYLPDGTKTAIFSGSSVPDHFDIRDAQTGEIAYSGIPEAMDHEDGMEETISCGDFSGLTLEGNYYIEAPYLGRSYTFSIGRDLYCDVFREACKQYYYSRCGMTLIEELAGEKAHNACHTGKAKLREDMTVTLDVSGGWHQDENGSKDVVLAAKNIGTLLLAYELFGDAFTDDMQIPESGNQIPDILDEIRYEVEWLLKMQNVETGAVYAGVTVTEAEAGKSSIAYVEPVTLDATKAYAMCLAKFSYLYQNYDLTYATSCLKAADRAWKYAMLNEETPSNTDPLKFAAAAELYRAAGLQECRIYLEQCLAAGIYKQERDEITFLGCVTYLSTKQPVDHMYCTQITQMLLSRAEQISDEARKGTFGVEESDKQIDNQTLLSNMLILTTVDYIIANHEYEMIIENHLHYFMGRNELAVSYLDHVGSRSYKELSEGLGIMKQFEADSKLIFMMSEIMQSNKQDSK